jgi:subtilisin family serine protease/archaellum component FlaC
MRKIRKAVSVILALIFVMPYLSVFARSVQGASEMSKLDFGVPELSGSLQGFLKGRLPYIDPNLTSVKEPTRVIMVVGDEANFSQIASYMISCRITPSLGGLRLIFGTVDARKVKFLASNTAIFAILKDREIDLMDFPGSTLSQGNFLKDTKNFRPDVGAPKHSPVGAASPNVTMREVVEIMNATSVWDDYEVTGENVTIAIIDTGVDYGSLGLGYWNVIARDMFGYPAAFDADSLCLAFTNITLTSFSNASGTFIPTAGLNPLVYMPGSVSTFSTLFGDVFPSNMRVTGILESGETCHWGVMFQWLFGLDLFPVLVADSDTDGIYDTVYVDISFDWSWIPYWYNQLTGETWPFWTAPWPPDFSFTDETPLNIANPVGGRDFTGSYTYDLSVSSLGYFLDVWGMSPNLDDRGLVLQPIDPNGNYTCFVYDFDGHGTSCASCAAGRDLGHPLFGNGLAYDAKIMGVTALYMGDVIEGELWAAGFDLIPGTEGWSHIPGYGTVYGIWTYTGNHKADIISNSWGLSDWALYSWMYEVPWYDVLTMFEDTLTIPEYLDPNYPGTIVIHAGGNGGSGYGTFTEPGYSTLAIGVGASTSMNWTQLYFGFAGGYYDDVIPWSARGPTALGTVKPDVLGIGAFGFAPTAVFLGLGDGAYAFDLFGGTSMATPVVAGAAALVVQGFREANGFSPTHEIVKTILKSTAVDLGYDPFLQGAGRVDCYRAVSLAMGDEGAVVSSEATWQNVLDAIQMSAWINNWISNGLIQLFTPQPISDTSWFAGTVKPGENTTAEFDVYNPTSEGLSVNVYPVIQRQIGSTTVLEGSTKPMPDDWKAWNWIWGNLTVLNNNLIPEDAELMTVSLAFQYDHFDPERDYVWNQRLGIMIQDWNDADVDGKVDINEVWQINYGYNFGTSNEVTVGFPKSKFKGNPIIFIYQRNNTGVLESIPFKLYISFYKRVPWNWIELSPTSFTVPSNGVVSFNAGLSVPSDTPPGVYEGQIVVNVNGRKLAVPVSVNVPTIIPAGQLVYDMATPEYHSLYNPFAVEGYFDWNWRYESGDWKNWLFEFADPATLAAFVYADWEGNMTDVDMFSIHPLGIVMDGTGNYSTGNGIFHWNTRTDSTEERVFMYTGSIPEAPPIPEVYTVLLHNVLFDGSIFPEYLSCHVKMIKVNPASPAHIMIPAGESKSITFTLSTGVELTNVTFTNDFITPSEIKPTTIEEIPEMGAQTINVTISVPSHLSPGRYLGAIYLMASELPMGIPIYIYVDVPALETLDVKLDVGEVHFPGEIAEVYLQISNKGLPIHLADTIPVKLWYRKPDGEFLSMNLNALLLDSGLYIAEFEVPVEATSCCLVVSIESYFENINVLYRGLSMDSFDISSTLNNWNAYLQTIVGDVATIKTDIGIINVNLTSINATLTDLILNSKGELIAVINTAFGTIHADLEDLNATLKSIKDTTVEIKTLLGSVKTSIDTIKLKVTLIEGNTTLIKTTLGELKGTLESVDGDVAFIKTEIGTIKVNVKDIEGYVEKVTETTDDLSQSTFQNLLVMLANVILSLIAAICSATALIRLRRKKPSQS